MIPEPSITAVMVHLLDLDKSDRVLEVGFGYGYEAAVIAQLAGTVHSIQQTTGKLSGKPQTDGPKTRLAKLPNIYSRDSNGILGWPGKGPYNAILVRQSMTEPPLALLKQLKPGGRMVVPIGMPNDVQRITVFKREPGGITELPTLHVKITPLLKGVEI